MADTRTALRLCPFCEATCGLTLTISEGRVTGARGDADDVFSAGFICPKGASFGELDAIPIADGFVWHPIRRRFDIRAFGCNAYTSEGVGRQIVEEHIEGSGHEECYIVLRGRARFSLDDEYLERPVVLGPDRVQACTDRPLLVQRRHDHGHEVVRGDFIRFARPVG